MLVERLKVCTIFCIQCQTTEYLLHRNQIPPYTVLPLKHFEPLFGHLLHL